MTSRVEITGQFNVDNALGGNSRPIGIDRHPTTVSTAGIRNWNAFCDSVDEELMPLSRCKTTARVAAVLFYAFIVIFVVGLNVLPRLLGAYGGDLSIYSYSSLMIYIIIIPYIYVYCQVRRKLAAVMKKVEEACVRHSASSVKYRLESEHWGGCNKPHVKRYFIMIDMNEVEVVVDDVEQQTQNANMTASDYFSTTAQPPSVSTSLADMLK